MLKINDLSTHEPKIEELNEEVYAKSRAYGAVINGTDTTAIEKAELEVKAAVEAFNALALQTTYKVWLQAENPILAALQDSMVAMVAIKVANSAKTGKTVECANDSEIVNLIDFDKYAANMGKDIMTKASWKASLEEMRKVFCGSCAMETQNENEVKNFLKLFDENFMFAHAGAQSNCGEDTFKNRYSTNNCVRVMQYFVDCIIYDDATGEGKNKYRVHRTDVSAVRLTISKRGRNLHTISYPNSATFLKNVTDTLIRIVTNAKYAVEYTAAK